MLFLYILDPQYPGEGISVKKLTNFWIYWWLEVWVASTRQINAPVLYVSLSFQNILQSALGAFRQMPQFLGLFVKDNRMTNVFEMFKSRKKQPLAVT